MTFFEFEGKEILKRFDIPVPESALVTSPDMSAPMPYPFMLKAQTMTGGRGKAGGVRLCTNEAEFQRNADEILKLNIKGHPVYGLLAEKIVKAEQELYLSITLIGVSRPTLIISPMGGMDIEAVSKADPEAITKIEIDPFTGLKDYQIKYILSRMPGVTSDELVIMIRKVQKLFFANKAQLIEINPLGVVDGALIALDCKLIIDEHALSMKPLCTNTLSNRTVLPNYQKQKQEHTTITYVPMSGNIGLISDGAGTGMLTLDLLTDGGMQIGSFCELGGMTSVAVMSRAMDLTLTGHPEIRGLFISLIGGFNRMDNMAEGITQYVRANNVTIPIYTRMCGNMQEIGLETMKQAGMVTYDALDSAVEDFICVIKGEYKNVDPN